MVLSRACMRFLDLILTLFIAFSVISFWRGVWLLWDNLVFKDDPTWSAIISLITGFVFIVITDIFMRIYQDRSVIQYSLAYPVEPVNIWTVRVVPTSSNRNNEDNPSL